MNNCQASFRQALKALGVYFKDMGRASSSVILRKSGESRNTSSKGAGRDRGREKRFVRFPLPPNRTGGSPASGSPVDGLTPKGIDEQFHGRLTD